MKQLMINFVAIFVIAIGGLSLTQVQPAQAQSKAIELQQPVTIAASCTENGKKVTGQCCAINDAGHCECWDCTVNKK